jgi:hypothetical protein
MTNKNSVKISTLILGKNIRNTKTMEGLKAQFGGWEENFR